jgi:hypothetical protein
MGGRCAGSSHPMSDQHAGSHPGQRATATPNGAMLPVIVSFIVASVRGGIGCLALAAPWRALMEQRSTLSRTQPVEGLTLLLQSSASGTLCYHRRLHALALVASRPAGDLTGLRTKRQTASQPSHAGRLHTRTTPCWEGTSNHDPKDASIPCHSLTRFPGSPARYCDQLFHDSETALDTKKRQKVNSSIRKF